MERGAGDCCAVGFQLDLCRLGAKLGNPQNEQMFSGLLAAADAVIH
jgi:hypothetical protein